MSIHDYVMPLYSRAPGSLRPNFIPSSRVHIAIVWWCIILVYFIFLCFLLLVDPPILDQCMKSYAERDALAATVPISDFWFVRFGDLLAILSCIFFAMALAGRNVPLVVSLWQYAMAGLWYSVCFNLLSTIRIAMNDTQCSGPHPFPLSISGHFFWYVLMSALPVCEALALAPTGSLPGFRQAATSAVSSAKQVALAFMYLFHSHNDGGPGSPAGSATAFRTALGWALSYVTFGAFELYHTYFWGFHSLRHVVYGVFSGLLAIGTFLTMGLGAQQRARRWLCWGGLALTTALYCLYTRTIFVRPDGSIPTPNGLTAICGGIGAIAELAVLRASHRAPIAVL